MHLVNAQNNPLFPVTYGINTLTFLPCNVMLSDHPSQAKVPSRWLKAPSCKCQTTVHDSCCHQRSWCNYNWITHNGGVNTRGYGKFASLANNLHLENCRVGCFRVDRGHSRSLVMSPFNTVHTSYISFPCTVCDTYQDISQKLRTSTHPTCI